MTTTDMISEEAANNPFLHHADRLGTSRALNVASTLMFQVRLTCS